MKWFHHALFFLYGATAVYFLYLAAIGIYVYFANRALGHEESFLIPGRNLAVGILITSVAAAGWYLIKYTAYQKSGNVLLFFPAIVVSLFFLYMISLLIASGGKWN